MGTSTIQPSFAAGELAPSLYARVDLARYQTGLRLCSNFFVMPYGGVKNRPGTVFVNETKGSGVARRRAEQSGRAVRAPLRTVPG